MLLSLSPQSLNVVGWILPTKYSFVWKDVSVFGVKRKTRDTFPCVAFRDKKLMEAMAIRLAAIA